MDLVMKLQVATYCMYNPAGMLILVSLIVKTQNVAPSVNVNLIINKLLIVSAFRMGS